MLRRKNRKKSKNEPVIEPNEPLSYPIGKAAEMLGMSKKTLMRHAEEMNLEFEWDGRGRRVRADDIQRLLSNGVLENNKSKVSHGRGFTSIARDGAESDDDAAYELELPIDIRVWQRSPSGKGVALKGDLFCDESYGLVHEMIKQEYGPGEYIIRPIEHGALSKQAYNVTILGEPWLLNQNRVKRENQNKGESFHENSPAEQEKLISQWVNFLRCWWPFAKQEFSNQKCFLTFEDFISARRSFKQFLSELQAEELKLITASDAYGLFESHLQRLCPPREEGEEDNASFSNAHEETQILTQMLQEIKEEMKRFEQEQSEKNTLLLFLCALCLILLVAPLLAQQPPPLTQQQPQA